jgi:hypothetical protein
MANLLGSQASLVSNLATQVSNQASFQANVVALMARTDERSARIKAELAGSGPFFYDTSKFSNLSVKPSVRKSASRRPEGPAFLGELASARYGLISRRAS